jgi:enoyl-CoA hydratase/carnithine racemase
VLSNAVFSRLARLPKPTIAMINGACLGGGFELALACHFRLCADNVRMGLPEVWINLVPGLGGFSRLARLIGVSKALELAALGDLISADEALRMNIVNRVYPKKGFLEHAESFLRALLVADGKVVQELIRLATCYTSPREEECIRESMESFARLAPWLRKT